MASAAYRLFREAIERRMQVIFIYDGQRREVCPHILGHTKGEEKVLAFQFAGRSKSQPLTEADWRCFFLSKVRLAHLREGPWHTGRTHSRTQVCVEDVDIDVNR